MNKQQKWVIIGLILLGLVYFAVFIPANNTGAKNAAMLSAFEHDEFAQYPNLIHMLQKGDSLQQTIHNFVVYLHYYYGYPFYFFSGLVMLPVKWILGADWASHTQTLVTILRQTINVLPIILAAFFLVLDQFKSKSPWKALLTFLLILTLPAVVVNDLWWHPDSLLVLFSVLTIYFLVRDQARLGKFFYISGIACALAIGAKFLGALFVLTYISYLIYAKVTLKHSWRKIVLSALLFLVVMFGSVLISNPLLLLPIERGEIIAAVSIIFSESVHGFYVVENGLLAKLAEIFRLMNTHYGGIILFTLSIGILICGFIKKKNVLKYLVILTWVVGYMGYFILFASTLRPYYFIPVILPLYASLLDFLPDGLNLFKIKLDKQNRSDLIKRIISMCLVLFTASLIVVNSLKTINTILTTSHREDTSGSLALYRAFDTEVFPYIPQDTPLLIYRDWRAYVADNPHWRVIYNWDLANYEYLAEDKPDLLFVESENALYFSDASKLTTALDKGLMQRMYHFYSDVRNGQVEGYQLVYKDSFGYIFVSDALFDQYFKK